jgi:cytochrome c553
VIRLVAVALLAPVLGGAGEAPPGAAACAGCHGMAARPGGAIPPVQGLPPEAILAALRDFRGGARPATVMNRIARGFTDDELQAIAAWVAAPP